jgi:uncharacterized protein
MNRPRILRLVLASVLTLAVLAPAQSAPESASRPKIRAVTAFVRLDRARYEDQIADALAFLHQAKSAFEKAGYEVQTIRVTTQPFPEYT